MATLSLEERMTALEAEVQQLKQRQEPDKSDASVPWWKKIVGIYEDDPEFEEAVRFGREWRESQGMLGDEGDD